MRETSASSFLVGVIRGIMESMTLQRSCHIDGEISANVSFGFS